MANIRFGDNDNTIAVSSSDTFFGEGGNDTYVFVPSLVPANAQITISDSEGLNTLRFLDGLEVVSSQVATLGNGTGAVLLTLSNGATIFIDGADSFDYEVGGAFDGTGSTAQNFSEFVTDTLDTTVPPPGQQSTGGPVTIGLPEVTITAGPDVEEGDAGDSNTLDFTVSLSQAASQDVTVSVAVTGGTADSGVDFTPPAATVTIPAGQLSAPVSIPITGEGLVELDETVEVSISNPVNAELGADTSATASILNDDLPVVSVSDASVVEGQPGDTRQLAFTISLDQASPLDVQVAFQTAGTGSATAGTDFSPTTQVVTIPAGLTSTQVVVDVTEETVVEPDETVDVVIANPVNAELGDAQGTGTIVNDDFPTVSVRDAAVVEGDDPLNPNQLVFTVELSEAFANGPVSVDIATVAGGSASAGADFTALGTTTVTFNPGDPLSQTVAVDVTADLVAEPVETVQVQLSNPVNATIADGLATGTIFDDDGPFVLTVDTDVITPSENSTVAQPPQPGQLPDGNDNLFIANQATLNGADEIDGGGDGADADELFVSSDRDSGTPVADVNGDGLIDNNDRPAVNLGGSTIRDIETVRVQANFDPANLDLSNATGIETLVNENSNTGVTFDALEEIVALRLVNLTGSQDTALFYEAEAGDPLLAGNTVQQVEIVGSDIGLLKLGGNAPGGANTATGVEQVDLAVTGGPSEIGGFVNDSLNALNVSGDQDVTFLNLTPQADLVGPAFGGTGAAGKTTGTLVYNGAANTGVQTLMGLGGPAVDYTVTTGTNDDVVDLRLFDTSMPPNPIANPTFDGDDFFNLGDGSDTVIAHEQDVTGATSGVQGFQNTEFLQVVDDDMQTGIGGTLNGFEFQGLTNTIQFRNATNTGPTGIEAGGVSLVNLDGGLNLEANLGVSTGNLNVDVSGGGAFTGTFSGITGTRTIGDFDFTDGQTLTLDLTGGGTLALPDVNAPSLRNLDRHRQHLGADREWRQHALRGEHAQSARCRRHRIDRQHGSARSGSLRRRGRGAHRLGQ